MKNLQARIDPPFIRDDHAQGIGAWPRAIRAQFGSSSQSNPVVVRDSWFHHSRDDGGVDHTDAILESYGGPSHMVFDHNTIVAVGNTNGLALQGDGYSNVTITRNYFSGFGYTVSAGLSGRNNKNVVFTGNTFGTDIKPEYGPLYGWNDGNGNVWRQNKWRVTPVATRPRPRTTASTGGRTALFRPATTPAEGGGRTLRRPRVRRTEG